MQACRKAGHFVKVYHRSQSSQRTNEIALPDANALNVDRSFLKHLVDAILCIANVSSTSGNQPQAIESVLDTGSAFSVLSQFTYNPLGACCFLSLEYICVKN